MQTEKSNVLGISVQGNGPRNYFQEDQWRKGFLSFLFTIWSNDIRFLYNPQIWFYLRSDQGGGHVKLTLNKNCIYEVSALQLKSATIPFYDYENGETLFVSSCRAEVETGLARFAKNNAIRVLVIAFGDNKEVVLWKHRSRGQLSVGTRGIEI